MLGELAPIYRALSGPPWGFSQDQIDGMELWVIAEVLGINDPPDPMLASTPEEFQQASRDLLAERVRRADAGLPPPPAPSSGPEVTPAMIAALRERRAQREKGTR